MSWLVLPSYLTTLPGAQKCLGKQASRMMLPNAFGSGPLGLRLCVHGCHGPHGIGFVHVVETAHHHPLGCAVGAPEVPTEHSIDSTGCRLRPLLAKDLCV
jgi:hypothetical protein